MIRFIFFGRTTHDKWIDIILDTFLALYKKWIWGRTLDIYGGGSSSNQCDLAHDICNDIVFHGWTTQEIIHEKLQSMDYCLMPSRVIETFGKSALEAMKYGVPVIGFQKWWLAQFIGDDLSLQENHAAQSLYDIVLSLCSSQIKPDRLSIQKWTLLYTIDHRKEKVSHLLGKKERILHISDFVSKIGGIELFLHESKLVLENAWHTVSLWWSTRKVSFIWLLYTLWNFPARWRLRKEIDTQRPTTIWFHSVLRYLGRIVLYWLPTTTTKICMIHDLWYFHPYPSRVYSIDDISEFSLRSFMKHGKWIVQKLLIALKYCSLRLIRRKLKKTIDIWLVPSPFLVDILHYSWWIPKEKIAVLPHFA